MSYRTDDVEDSEAIAAEVEFRDLLRDYEDPRQRAYLSRGQQGRLRRILKQYVLARLPNVENLDAINRDDVIAAFREHERDEWQTDVARLRAHNSIAALKLLERMRAPSQTPRR